jgi:hypothetical protein
MNIRFALYSTIAILVLSLPACVKQTDMVPTSQSPSLNTPVKSPGELSISSSNSFVDSYGTYRVVGLVENNTNDVFSAIELSIEIKDEAGNSLLKDDAGSSTPNTLIYPFLYTIAPGEGSPFEYSFDTTGGVPASYDVSIAGKQAGNANRATLQSDKVQNVDDGSGWFYLTGELVNTGNQWAHINSLAGGVMDESNSLLSTDWTSTYTTELAPAGDALGRDRTPFQVNFPNPGGSTQWKLYWDADNIENVVDNPLAITTNNFYFDQYGSAHLVGWITNQSDQTLDSLVIAGLRAADGTVLDSSYAYVPIPVKPGANDPFSISSFGSVDFNANQASRVNTASAQADPWFTTPPTSEQVDLFASDETVQKNGATWIINGSVANSSDKDLSGITVVVMVLDSQNLLVAMEYASISSSGEAIVIGETKPYSITILLDPAADTNSFTTTTLVIGDVK